MTAKKTQKLGRILEEGRGEFFLLARIYTPAKGPAGCRLISLEVFEIGTEREKRSEVDKTIWYRSKIFSMYCMIWMG